jgi:GR25 family glycosyltransferase involved in LPS biosynthesis
MKNNPKVIVILVLVLVLLIGFFKTSRRRTNSAVAVARPQLLPPFDVYVINLDSAHDRLGHFKKEVANSDLVNQSFIRFPAIRGASLDIQAMVSPKALWEISEAERTGFRLRHYQLSRGAVGCYTSHMRLWESILKTDKEVALIFEDDAQIFPTIHQYATTTAFPSDFDLILLGYVCFKCRKDSRSGFVRVNRFFGMHGYLISTRGIRKILANHRVSPIRKQIDSMLSDMAQAGDLIVYATPRKYVEQNNENFGTQIQVPIKEGENPWEALQDD